MKNITIVSPTYNEEQVISKFLDEVLRVISSIDNYNFDIIIIDNASIDKTQEILRNYAKKFKNIKLIFNVKNFGHIRSPYWGVIQTNSDAVIYLVSDMQEPPRLIPEFIKSWEDGFNIVYGVKNSSKKDGFIISLCRKLFYFLISSISTSNLVSNATGFGLYDKKIIEIVKKINDPYPYFRGLVAEIGYPIKQIKYTQEARKYGKSKNNFYTLYDIAILGITSHSSIPLRICSFMGLIIGLISFLFGLYYLVYKLLFWDAFSMGLAPLLIFILFLFGALFFFLGIFGEYILSILRYVNKKPIVIEKERINFDK